MCAILMPIKPEYVYEILNGNKKYEYRKIKAKKDNVDKMIIYATAPIKKIVAEVKIVDILEDTPDNIWKKTQKYSGIEKKFYNSYYKNKDVAIAYQLENIIKYEKPLDLKDLGINYYPQSFVYLEK